MRNLVSPALGLLAAAFLSFGAAPSALAKEPAGKVVAPASLNPPLSPAASVGMSAERVDRITKTMQRYVDEKRIAGTVTYLMRHGKLVHFEATGWADVENKVPMKKDTIFRIASMSKGSTSIAAMILIEEGLLSLETPVSKFFPGFKKTTVALPPPPGAVPGSPVTIVPAKREIVIRDLLTHTAGISYGYGPGAAMWKAAGIQGWYLADRAEPVAAVVERMASLPFDAQPGEAFVYGYNTDILGAVIEKASGKPLDVFLKERIFDPLRMVDTSFFLPPEKRSRLAVVYTPREDGTIMRAPDTAAVSPGGGMIAQGAYVDGPRMCFAGGAGLLSTATDYARLTRMLANGGSLDGVRILSPKTVQLMTSNFVGNLNNDGRTGFGLGFEVVEHMGRSGRYGSPGAFGWGAAYYANYWVDPQEDMVGLYFSQFLPYTINDLQAKFRTLAYAALETLGK